jgi:hypothetical protein
VCPGVQLEDIKSFTDIEKSGKMVGNRPQDTNASPDKPVEYLYNNTSDRQTCRGTLEERDSMGTLVRDFGADAKIFTQT